MPVRDCDGSSLISSIRLWNFATYLVEVDCGLPELLLGLVEVPHTDFTEVTRVVLVEVGAVVVLTTGHTTTTGMLTVLSDTTVTGGNMTAARKTIYVSLLSIPWLMMVISAVARCQFSSTPSAVHISSGKFEREKGNSIVCDAPLSCLSETGRHLVEGAVFDKCWRWGCDRSLLLARRLNSRLVPG